VVDDDEVRKLVERARSRDADAWEALYRNSYTRLLAYARRRLPRREQADDAVSETMARALDRIDRFSWRGAGLDAWLYGICRNVILEMSRKETRGGARPVAEEANEDDGPLDLVLKGEEEKQIREAFARLSAEDQEILELRVVGQLGAEAVGEVLGKRPGAVRMAQSRALSRLRSLLRTEEAPSER